MPPGLTAPKAESNANVEWWMVWKQTRRHRADGFLGDRGHNFCRKESRIRYEEDLLHPGELCRHRGNDLLRDENDRVDKKERGVRSGEDLFGRTEDHLPL